MTSGDIGTRPLVLLVDPDDETRDLYGHWLWGLGFGLVTVADAQMAAATARRYQPLVIVTELQLRASDGLLLIRRLQASAATRHLPIVVVTRVTEPKTLQAATVAGAVAVMPSLTDFDRLRTILERIVARVAADAVRSSHELRAVAAQPLWLARQRDES